MISAVVAYVWASISTLGVLASAFVHWRSSSLRTTAGLWQEEAQAWRTKAERLERALEDLDRRVCQLENENQVLRSLHDSREEIEALKEAVTSGFAMLAEHLEGVKVQ